MFTTRVSASHPSKRHLWPFYIGGGVLLLALILTITEVTNTTYLFHKRPTYVSASTSTKGEEPSSAGSSTTSSTQSTSKNSPTQPGDEKSNTGSQSSTELIMPTGDFVSNHHPNLSGHPAPNSMTSVCTTTPGVTCTISFTKDGVTKSLPSQTTDRGGSTYWNWKLQDLDLTTGSWQIKATATLGTQTKSALDAMTLDVAK